MAFTRDNTEGYTDGQLVELNRRLAAAVAASEPIADDIRNSHEKNLAEQILVAFDLDLDCARFAKWLNAREGLSDDPLRRAAQIALSALDEIITSGDLEDGTGATVAYDALQAALAE